MPRHWMMAMHDAGEAPRAPGSQELISAPEFFKLLRQVLGFREQPATADPLQSMVDQITRNPYFAQSRLLMRILLAIPSQRGEFRRAEAAALDAGTLALVITVLDVHASGGSVQSDWKLAIDAAEAASR